MSTSICPVNQEPDAHQFHDHAGGDSAAERLDEEILARSVIKLDGHLLGLTFGIMCALTIFIATDFLLIKGGNNVGAHLILLSQFFPGYSVTFLGSLCGAVYGFIFGYVCGWIVGVVYTAMAWLRSR